MALVDVRRAYFYAPSRRRVFVEVPPEEDQAGDEHTCGLLQYRLYGTRDAAHNWRAELASTLQRSQVDERDGIPCVWQGCIKGKHIVATLHRDDITIGGERSVVEFLVKKILRKYEVKKQVIGEDADLWKSGRILNRVIDGITNKRQVKMQTSRRLKLS